MSLLIQFALSFCATAGFAIYFNAPPSSVLPSAISGGLSWSLYHVLFYYFDQKIMGAFLAAFLVGSLGEILAIKLRKPATVFITPDIVPLVPGAGMYYTMSYLVEKNFDMAASKGTETFFVAASIAIGIISSTVVFRSLRNIGRPN